MKIKQFVKSHETEEKNGNNVFGNQVEAEEEQKQSGKKQKQKRERNEESKEAQRESKEAAERKPRIGKKAKSCKKDNVKADRRYLRTDK